MHYRCKVISILIAACSSCATFQRNDLPPLKVVRQVDLQRYMGAWYEIARYPNRFQKECTASKATYSLRDDGKIDVLNQCEKIDSRGKLKQARGKAWVAGNETNAKLKVSFFWPFKGDYWIIDLDSEYTYAVVGHPKRKYLWILSRKPVMEPESYQKILQRLEKQSYDTSRLLVSAEQQAVIQKSPE